jgi:hypothetical protein
MARPVGPLCTGDDCTKAHGVVASLERHSPVHDREARMGQKRAQGRLLDGGSGTVPCGGANVIRSIASKSWKKR